MCNGKMLLVTKKNQKKEEFVFCAVVVASCLLFHYLNVRFYVLFAHMSF